MRDNHLQITMEKTFYIYYAFCVIPIFLVSASILTGCTQPAPKRSFLDSELLLKFSDLPEGWVAAESTDNYIEKDYAEQYSLRYYQYSLTTYLVKSGEDLYRYKNLGIAYNNYKRLKKYYFFSECPRSYTMGDTARISVYEFISTAMAFCMWSFNFFTSS